MFKNCCDKSSCCSHVSALVVAGVIFGFFALVHLYRLFVFFPVVVGTLVVPTWVSVVVFIVAGLLSVWMFRAASCEKKEKLGPPSP